MTDAATETTTSTDTAPATSKPKRKIKIRAKPPKPPKTRKPARAKKKARNPPGHSQAEGHYALICRIPMPLYKKAWRKVEQLKKAGKLRSMSSWLLSVIEKAAQ